jgi:hypothetical protein
VGDCDGNGQVRINELITGVSVALGTVPSRTCEAIHCDAEGESGLGVACLVVAVNNAMTGCERSIDAVWLFYVPCRQCEACQLSVDELLGHSGQIPPQALPDGITVLDSEVEIPQIVCAACG